MSKEKVDSGTEIRDERFVETNPKAFQILSKEESEKRRKEAKEKRKEPAATPKEDK